MSSVVIAGTPPSGDTALPVANSIDPVNDYVPIYTASATATQAINRNTYLNLSSQPVGLTDTQTLTNKTLTSPTISSPTLSGTTAGTFTLGGTITFPTSVVQLTSTQTLTNKTLTSPTINSPTITNATISADAITGYTTSNSGTIYGISVSTGNVSLSGTLAVSSNATVGGTLGVTGVLTPSAGLSANSVKSTALALSNALDSTNGVKSQSNAGSAGGTMYYINLGGIKLCWGTTASSSTSTTSTTINITLPTSFFSTIQSVTLNSSNVGTVSQQGATVVSFTTTTIAINLWTLASSGTAYGTWLVIGT